MAFFVNPFSKTKSTPRYVNQVREWIGACDKLHGGVCVPEPIPQRPPQDVPIWLIDTHQQCIIPGLSAHKYLALSYVWPETRGSSDFAQSTPKPQTLLLDNVSIADFQSPGFLSNEEVVQRIPMVIRHAMELCNVLGERYLWVDRLCIVQNDFGDGGTLSQVAKMDKIYGGAYLTIIAAAPEEMYEKDLALEWPSLDSATSRYIVRAWTLASRMMKNLPQSFQLPDMHEEEITEHMSAWYAKLSKSRWATRGWTYQEQILCKRAVVFVESGFFWDCQCCVWDGIHFLPDRNFAGVALRADMGQRFSTRWWPDFGFYLDLICPYNGREFSYPQDAKLGILGILSALEKSFPGGFIHGLPRLFLDHALLWQPFGTVTRRVDRAEDVTNFSSLPSWSWCGWQGFVDPWSLRSGSYYIYEKGRPDRAGSWRTRNLVEWHISIGDRISEPVLEPSILDQYVDVISATDVKLPDGWTAHSVSSLALDTEPLKAGPLFTHDVDRSTYFKHPVPLKEALSEQSLTTTPAYLSCSTTTASLFPATVLNRESTSDMTSVAPSKISVFEDNIFNLSPPDEKTSPILVLQQSNGAFAGLLRLMSEGHIDETTPLDLIAISTGSASVRDLRQSLEWRLFETGLDKYWVGNSGKTFHYAPQWISGKGKYALLFDFAMAFDKEASNHGPVKWDLDATLTEINQISDERITHAVAKEPGLMANEVFLLREWFKARNYSEDGANRKWNPLHRKAWNTSTETSPVHQYPHNQEDVCEFYNVLWIERSEGMAHRRACGWVPKYIWESHATGPVEVKLG